MNNIVNRAIEHASAEYKVTILLDESNASHFSELEIPDGVKAVVKKTSTGTYLEISGDAEKVMALEVQLYDIISSSFVYLGSQEDVALAESL
ncbi:MAG: hypothetical protein JW825_02825 [Candidatus Methanofastidiosa archaeon]|nr:hypothetical protein [Candidatus Methanofastidiosa archaeon]